MPIVRQDLVRPGLAFILPLTWALAGCPATPRAPSAPQASSPTQAAASAGPAETYRLEALLGEYPGIIALAFGPARTLHVLEGRGSGEPAQREAAPIPVRLVGGLITDTTEDLAVDAQGTAFTANVGIRGLQSINVAGNVFGEGTMGTPDSVRSIAIAPDGARALIDAARNRILRAAPGGAFEPWVGPANDDADIEGHVDGAAGRARFRFPTDLAWGADGTLYVADSGNRCIRKVAADGTVSTYAGRPDAPADVVEDANANLDGTLATARFRRPISLAAAPQGRLIVADHDLIRLITPDGRVRTIATGERVCARPTAQPEGSCETREPASFTLPKALAADENGDIYLSDHVGRRIWRLIPSS